MESSDQEIIVDADARGSIAWHVRSGFYDSDEIVSSITELVMEETPNATEQYATRAVRSIVAAEWAAQQERQHSWPDEPTVSDKLQRAFNSLERNHKIVARMNFACCQTCGVAEISGESDEDDDKGYVFFHEQDTEGAVESGDLYLAFGSFTQSEKKNLSVGDTIVRSLRRAGLSVVWARNTKSRIMVRCGSWRRKFQEDEDIEDVQDDDFDLDSVSSNASESEVEPDTYSDLDPAGIAPPVTIDLEASQ